MGQFPPAEIWPLEISARSGKRHCRWWVTVWSGGEDLGALPRWAVVVARGGSEAPVMTLSPSGVGCVCVPDAAGGRNWKAVLFYDSNKREIGESI